MITSIGGPTGTPGRDEKRVARYLFEQGLEFAKKAMENEKAAHSEAVADSSSRWVDTQI